MLPVRGLAILGVVGSLNALEPDDLLFHRIGSLQIRPQLNLLQQYDDNIFYRESRTLNLGGVPIDVDKEDDFLTIINPGVNLELGRPGGNSIQSTYNFSQRFYWDHSDQDSGDHFVTLDGAVQQGRFTFTAANSVSFLTGIIGGSDRLGQRADRLVLGHSLEIDYAITEKTSVYTRGRYDSTDYESGTGLLDRDRWSVAGGFSYQVSPKLRVFGEGDYGERENDTNRALQTAGPTQEAIGGSLGVRGNFTDRLVGTVQAGWEHREFDVGSESDDSPTVNVSLSQTFNDGTNLTLSYARASYLSVQASGVSYNSDAVTLSVRRAIGVRGKWFATVRGSYRRADYSSSRAGFDGRVDNSILVGADIVYQIQEWLRATLGYDFEKFDTDLDATLTRINDYQANRVTMTIGIGY